MGMDIRVLDSLQKVFADEELPAGGTAGQFLVKTSDADYDAAWQTVTDGNEVAY